MPLCHVGYTGEFCNLVNCINPNCSGNGIRQSGKCKCFNGFTGDIFNSTVLIIPNNLCSNHEDFDYNLKTCKFELELGWTDVDCSQNENCVDKICKICKNGWDGLNCV